jgi:hypothetical protein
VSRRASYRFGFRGSTPPNRKNALKTRRFSKRFLDGV